MTVLTERQPAAAATRTRAWKYMPGFALGSDLVLVALTTLAAVEGRESIGLFKDYGEDLSSTLAVVGPFAIVGWLLCIFVLGGYRADVFGTGPDEVKRVFNASLLAAGLLGVGCYLTKFQLSRGFFFLLFIVGIPALILGRLALRRLVKSARQRGALGQRVVIAGSPANIDEIASVLSREPWLGYRVVGALTPATHTDEETAAGVPVVGNADDITAMIQDDVDVVFFAGGSHTSATEMRRTFWQLEQHDVQVVIAPNVTEISSDRVQVRPVGGLPLMHIGRPTWSEAVRIGKRSFDLLGSIVLLVLLSPLFVTAALWIKMHDRGPILFAHSRVGRGGTPFDCLKFRTMVQDADRLMSGLREDHDALLFKLRDDPRVTRPGRWLRRFSIDELPQLVNVVRGDMSLVGPRPQVAAEVALYDDAMSRRLHVRPGMTGLWQVSGRSDLSVEESQRLDLYYVDNWSMLQDLNILARTLGAVLRSRGAY